ncbi:hypothetical protein M885DRAFT_303871 [Pelagophyceae sp. CCMP2097]|nr:hypothetical protein M885DRAFT_303871 [Pelagophyceae sp. CCMP2097]
MSPCFSRIARDRAWQLERALKRNFNGTSTDRARQLERESSQVASKRPIRRAVQGPGKAWPCTGESTRDGARSVELPLGVRWSFPETVFRRRSVYGPRDGPRGGPRDVPETVPLQPSTGPETVPLPPALASPRRKVPVWGPARRSRDGSRETGPERRVPRKMIPRREPQTGAIGEGKTLQWPGDGPGEAIGCPGGGASRRLRRRGLCTVPCGGLSVPETALESPTLAARTAYGQGN